MKFTVKDILSNQIVLFFVAFLCLTSIFGYLVLQEYAAILFFLLVAFLTRYFNKNLTVILGISLIATNLLGAITNMFAIPKVREGMTTTESDTNIIEEKTIVNPESTLLEDENQKQETETISQKYEDARKRERKYDDLDSLMATDGVRNLSKKANSLIAEQGELMQQMKDMGPLIQTTLQAITNLGSGNQLEVLNSLGGSLDKLYEKYPNTFPKDYKDKSIEFNDILNKLNNTNKI